MNLTYSELLETLQGMKKERLQDQVKIVNETTYDTLDVQGVFIACDTGETVIYVSDNA